MQIIPTILKTALLFIVVCAGAHAADPLKKLSSAQLDSVAAGYLTVEVYAAANAIGPVTQTNTVTDVFVRQFPESDDGYIYTKGKGSAFAYAQGTDVYTFVDGLFDTDEEIVSVKIIYKKNRTKRKKSRKPNKHGKSKKHRHKKQHLVTERSRFKIRVVTRVPAL